MKIYSGIETLKGDDTHYIKQKWENEANIKLMDEEWEDLTQQIWRVTSSLTWREHGWKNLVRYFRTPAQTKYRDTSCWRECGEQNANHVHIFWSCPSMKKYWMELKQCMDEILRVNLPFNFDTFYLGRLNMQGKKKKSEL